MVDNKDLKELYNSLYYAAERTWIDFFEMANNDLNNYLGDQWSQKEKDQLNSQRRSTGTTNMIKRNIDFLIGSQIKNRLNSVVTSVDDAYEKEATILSRLIYHVMNTNEGYRTISKCFSGALTTGISMATLSFDYTSDPIDGDIKIGSEEYNSFLIDPGCKDLSLKDCTYLLRRKYMTVSTAISVFPNYKEEILDACKRGGEGVQGGYVNSHKYPWLKRPNSSYNLYRGYTRDFKNNTCTEFVAIDEVLIKNWQTRDYLYDRGKRSIVELESRKEEKELASTIPGYELIKATRPHMQQIIFANEIPIYSMEDPFHFPDFPAVPVYAIWKPECTVLGNRLQSWVRSQISPQHELNKHKSRISDIMETSVNSGYVIKDGALVNQNDAYSLHGQGNVVWRAKNSEREDVERLSTTSLDPSLPQQEKTLSDDIGIVAGIPASSFGETGSSQESGLMFNMRVLTSNTGVQELFDNLRNSQKLIAEKIIVMTQEWSPEKIEKITRIRPDENFYSMDVSKYKVRVEETVLTTTQKQEHFLQMKNLVDMGVKIPDEDLINAAPLHQGEEVRQGLIERSKAIKAKEEEEAKLKQQQTLLEIEFIKAKIRNLEADSLLKQTRSSEKDSRIPANIALESERHSKTLENLSEAELTHTQALEIKSSLPVSNAVKLSEHKLDLEENARKNELHEIQKITSIKNNLIEDNTKQKVIESEKGVSTNDQEE